LNVGKPTLLISIGIREGTKTPGDAQENCPTKKNYRKHNQAWQLQQPFYVEEPRWIEIDSDYMDAPSRRVNGGDPYILSRGKKIFWLKDPEQASKIAEDYDEFPDYPSKRPLMKVQVSKFIEMNEKAGNNVDQRERLYNDENGIAPDANRRNKRSAIPRHEKFAEVRRRYKTRQIGWMNANPGKMIRKNGTDILEQMGKKARVDLGSTIYDDLSSRRNKSSENEMETSNKRNINDKEKPQRMELYAHPEKLSDEENKTETSEDDDAEAMDSRLISLMGELEASRAFAMKNRGKRNVCDGPACVSSQLQSSELLRNIEKEIHDSLSLERRDKHRDNLLESLQLSEPYVISRGKKASHAEDHLYFTLKSQIANEENRLRMPNAARRLLRMLLTAKFRCNSGNCDVNALEPMSDRLELAPRDRRGILDDILAGYDPYYVARGKRASL
jgi:hypothetical protein